jgi:acylphosphatase
MPDGSVEVLACGRDDAIEKLAAWLRDGPRMASVAGVDCEEVDYQEFNGFGTA